MTFSRRARRSCRFLLYFALFAGPAAAADPLHERLDKIVESTHVGPPTATVGDGEFLRRLALDLNGIVPTTAETRAFLADSAPTKRQTVVDRMLADPRYAFHMANVFDVMLMERRGDKGIPAPEWQKYLYESFARNKPYDQLAREVLSADGSDPLRPAAKFYLDRDGDPHLLTRDVSRVFFGRDLQCAQCHDHPLIDDYKQAEYYGLFGFFARGFLFTDKDKKVFYAEKAEGSVDYHSVFDPTKKQRPALPSLVGGRPINEPVFLPGDEYTVKAAENVRPIPKFSRRAELAKLAADGKNRAFNRNIVNRLWAHMMGRGLIDPPDLQHTENAAFELALLDVLADEFVAMKFDIKGFLRELALSRTYQRAVEAPADLLAHTQAMAAVVPALEAEATKQKAIVAPAEAAAGQSWEQLSAAHPALLTADQETTKASAAMAEVQKNADAANKALNETQQQLTAKQEIAKTVAEAAAKTDEVAKKLATEADLVQAAAKFKTRADQLASETQALAKAVQEKTAASKTVSDQLEGQKKAVVGQQEKLIAARNAVADLHEKYSVALAKLHNDLAASTRASSRLAEHKLLSDWSTRLVTWNASRAAVEQAAAQVTQGKPLVEAATAALAAKQAELQTMQKAAAEIEKLLAAAKTQLAMKTEVVQALTDAVAKIDVAKQKLPNDAELAKTIDVFKPRIEQAAKEMTVAQAGLQAQESAYKAATEKVVAAQTAMQTAAKALADQQAQQATREGAHKTAVAKADTDRQAVDEAHRSVVERWSNRFALRNLKPLSPEQMTWSVLQVSGIVDQYRAAAEAELQQKKPLDDAAKKDPAKLAERAVEIEQQVQEKLKGNVAAFVPLFGAGPAQPPELFVATVDQALFMANGGAIQSWLAPAGNNLTGRLAALQDPKALADELYLSVLHRKPSDAELADTTQYLATRAAERPAAIQELAWALLTSSEFRFNH